MPAARHRTFSLDVYVADTLMPDLVGHDRTPAAFVVFVYLWRQGQIARGRAVVVSHATIAEETGLSKSAVQAATRLLKRRQLIAVMRRSLTAVPEYRILRPWRRR
jgi:hypothetical protein